MFILKSKNQNFGIALPTSIDEFTNDMLREATKHIELAPNYAIVAIHRKLTLFDLALTMTNNKHENRAVVIPVIAKANIPEDVDWGRNTEIGDRVLISPMQLERGLYVSSPVGNGLTNVANYIANDDELKKELISKTYKGNIIAKGNIGDADDAEIVKYDNQTRIIVTEFKIVPITDIYATANPKIKVEDPFIYYERPVDNKQ